MTGIASNSIPLQSSPGRNNFTPSLTLDYNSNGDKSPLGLEWRADYPTIQRKTEKKLPEYKDAIKLGNPGEYDLSITRVASQDNPS